MAFDVFGNGTVLLYWNCMLTKKKRHKLIDLYNDLKLLA